MTNDARVNKLLLDPTQGHAREYLVQVEGEVTDQALEQLQKGVQLNLKGQSYMTRPCHSVRLAEEPAVGPRDPPIRERKLIPTSWLQLKLTEVS